MVENIGKITQVMGPVIDVEFEQGNLPTIYTALLITIRPSMTKRIIWLSRSPSIWGTMWFARLPWM